MTQNAFGSNDISEDILRVQTIDTGGGEGMTSHALNGPYHSGTLDDSQAPQFALLDGSRQLTGLTLSVGFQGTLVTGLNADLLDGLHAAAFALASHTHSLNDITNPTANKAFSMTSKSLSFTWTNPVSGGGIDGAMELEVTGNFTGDLLHVHQHTGAPGVGTDLIHLESDSTNVNPLRITSPGTVAPMIVSSSVLVSNLNANYLNGLSQSSAPGATASILATDASGWTYPLGLEVANHFVVGNGAIASNLTPSTTDTYNLGSASLLWSQAFISQLNAVVFADSTAQLLGGWLIIPKDAGTVGAVASAATQVDFGKTMTAGNIIVIRSKDASNVARAEYMSIGTLVSGTTYNVTRDLANANSPDPVWSDGTPFMLMGTTGDGRIELNAYDTPRISLMLQGATYNAQTETMRIGDLNGGWGYVTQTFGVAIGEYASGKSSFTVDATNGIRILNSSSVIGQWDAAGNVTIGQVASSQSNVYISAGALQVRVNTTERIGLTAAGVLTIRDSAGSAVFTFNASAGAEFTLPLTIASTGGIYQGTGTFASPTTGLKVWNDTGVGRIAGYNAGTLQWYANTDGKLYAGGGNLSIDANGVQIAIPTGGSDPIRAYKFVDGTTNYSQISAYKLATEHGASLYLYPIAGLDSYASVSASAPTGKFAQALLGAVSGSSSALLTAVANGATSEYYVLADTNFKVSLGLNVGSATGATTGQIKSSGDMFALGKLKGVQAQLLDTGIINGTADLSLTTSYQDLTGATVTFTPSVNEYIYVWLHVTYLQTGMVAGDFLNCALLVNGSFSSSSTSSATTNIGTHSQVRYFKVSLNASTAYTIKIQVRNSTRNAGTVYAGDTQFFYWRIAR
jgi:hypothetical protein